MSPIEGRLTRNPTLWSFLIENSTFYFLYFVFLFEMEVVTLLMLISFLFIFTFVQNYRSSMSNSKVSDPLLNEK
ncbi:hypothetical protein RHMOL_Rhmol08G0223800 [Rhododendron molle]|uniref:Uncharacterized protein n=1 Tax=Rhododendron molle TaxID=49168 RepID=A0ACC0MT73_RHOML|nr:hypothetical protein RHMOL_Rhmol08G0223800 [Rhododendron molle]